MDYTPAPQKDSLLFPEVNVPALPHRSSKRLAMMVFGVVGVVAGCVMLLRSSTPAPEQTVLVAQDGDQDKLLGFKLPFFSSSDATRNEAGQFDMQRLIENSKNERLVHLEKQALDSLAVAMNNFDHAVFPNAMILGDCVLTHLLHRLGALKSEKVKIMVVDTFHLFDETMPFLHSLEDQYGFKAEIFKPEGCEDKAEYDVRYGADLWKENIEQYDKVCKVEPFQRGLKTLNTDAMINGRRRDHGNERAYIDLYENAPIGGGMAKINPLAYWTFEDCFDYVTKYRIPIHPLHSEGYPSHGDAKDTVKVPLDGSVRFVDYKFVGDKSQWLDYASERKGRFVGLANQDGSAKTECGIHVAGAERTFDRDLWPVETSKVVELDQDSALELKKPHDKPHLMVVYAPWCQFCQGMEQEFERLAEMVGTKGDLVVSKLRGDEQRALVESEFDVTSFPTINLMNIDGTRVKYESEVRNAESLLKFVEQNLGHNVM